VHVWCNLPAEGRIILEVVEEDAAGLPQLLLRANIDLKETVSLLPGLCQVHCGGKACPSVEISLRTPQILQKRGDLVLDGIQVISSEKLVQLQSLGVSILPEGWQLVFQHDCVEFPESQVSTNLLPSHFLFGPLVMKPAGYLLNDLLCNPNMHMKKVDKNPVHDKGQDSHVFDPKAVVLRVSFRSKQSWSTRLSH